MTQRAASADLDLDALLDAAGAVLAAKLTGGTFVDGFEAGQANEVIAALDADGRYELLAHLVHLRFQHLIAVDCLLDECAGESYEIAESMAGQLIEEILRQNRFDEALYQLTVSAIDRRAQLIQHGGPVPR